MASKILVLALSVQLSALLGNATTAFAQSQRTTAPTVPRPAIRSVSPIAEPLQPGEAMICPIRGVAITFTGIITPIGIIHTAIADARFR